MKQNNIRVPQDCLLGFPLPSSLTSGKVGMQHFYSTPHLCPMNRSDALGVPSMHCFSSFEAEQKQRKRRGCTVCFKGKRRQGYLYSPLPIHRGALAREVHLPCLLSCLSCPFPHSLAPPPYSSTGSLTPTSVHRCGKTVCVWNSGNVGLWPMTLWKTAACGKLLYCSGSPVTLAIWNIW